MFNGVEPYKEEACRFDSDPTKIYFTKNNEEDHTMTKEEFVIHMIQHSEYFPDVDELSTPDAAAIISNIVPDKSFPKLTPDELVQLWNRFIHDPSVMDID